MWRKPPAGIGPAASPDSTHSTAQRYTAISHIPWLAKAWLVPCAQQTSNPQFMCAADICGIHAHSKMLIADADTRK